MKHITDILIEQGYKAYAFISHNRDFNSEAKSQVEYMLSTREDIHFISGDKNSRAMTFLVPKDKNEISTMLAGGINVFYVKDFDMEKCFIWGLHEAYKPPTLINPRPNILHKDSEGRIIDERFDDAMNHCLAKENHYEILKAIDNKSVFNYI